MRFLGVSLATLFTGLFISLFASLPVNAQSSTGYLAPELMLGYNESCEIPPLNISTTWLNFFTQPGWVASNGQPGVYDVSGSQYLDKLTEFREGVQNDTIDWAVFVSEPTSSTKYFYNLVYAPKGQFYNYLNYNSQNSDKFTNYFSRYNDARINQITIRQTGGECGNYNVTATYNNASLAMNVQDEYKIFLNNFIYDYSQSAPGYDDPQNPPIPDSYEVTEPTTLAPNYDLTIQADGTFRFVVNHFLAFGGGFRLGNLSGHSSVVYCEIESYEDYECLGEEGWDWSFTEFPVASLVLDNLKLPEAGYYKFYVDNSDVSAPVPPFPHDLAPYKILDRRILVYWDGFSILEVNTLGNNDTEEVRADENNISNKFFDMLDIPTFGLIDVVVLPLAFISNLDDMECQPVILPLPNNIGNLQLPCMTEEVYEPRFPSILTIYQTILIGLFSYYIALRMFGNIKELSNPKDDRIEVAKL